MTSWFEAEGSIPIDVDDWWWFAEEFGGGCGNQVGVWRGGKKQLSERGWGVLFSTTQNILRDFLPFAQKLFLVHIQGFKSSSPASLPLLHSISLSC